MFEVKGKSVLITGGSRGLGRALGVALAAEGAKIVLVARGESELGEAVNEIRRDGGTVFGIIADVGDKQSIYPIAAQAAALAGPIDILINNASTLGALPLRLMLDTDCEDLEQVLEVNTLGPFRLIKAAAGSMLLRRSGLIVNVSSDAAVEAYPEWGAYGVSKAALDHLTRIVAVELENTGVRFFSLDPGEIDTRMHADAMPGADRTALARPEAVAAKIVSMIRHSSEIQSGARLIASGWEADHVTSASSPSA